MSRPLPHFLAPGFADREGRLACEAVPLERVAAEVGTPVYVYSSLALRETYGGLQRSLARALGERPFDIFYSVKANGNLAVVRTLLECGAGADAVSEGEVRRALAAGVPPERIVFAGVGKTDAELAFALEAGILQINVESESELRRLGRIAAEKGVRAAVALRVNPDVDPKTHAKIATGQAETKFGLDHERLGPLAAEAAAAPGLELVGLSVHIGSQLGDWRPFEQAFERLAGLYRELRAAGHALGRLDLGGGIPVPYRAGDPPADPETYAGIVARATRDLDAHLLFEPGRFLVANAGVLLTRVVAVKPGRARRFLVLDAAMNDLIRPTLYEAWHEIVPVDAIASGAASVSTDVVGPVCETGDFLARERPLPPIPEGALVAVTGAGAYAAVMASQYNARPLAPEVLIRGERLAVVRERPSFATMLSHDRMAPWLGEGPDREAAAE